MYKVQINYKSGNSFIFECEEFSVKTSTSDGSLIEVSFTNLKPKLMYIGINNIESIIQLQ